MPSSSTLSEHTLHKSTRVTMQQSELINNQRWSRFRHLLCMVEDSDFLGRTLQLRMCFLPNSRASIDNAPGPIIASVPPNVASESAGHPSLECTNAIHTSTAAISAPVAGVHKPNIIKIASTAPMPCGAIVA